MKLKFLAACAALFVMAVGPAAAAALTATPADAAAVLKAAPDGSTVVLQPGAYARVLLRDRGPITIDAAQATSLTAWEFRDSRGVTIKNAKLRNGCVAAPCYATGLIFSGGEGVTLSNLSASGPDGFAEGYGVRISNVKRVAVSWAHFERFKMALGLTKVDGAVVQNVGCNANRSDCVNLAQVWNVLVENVACHGTALTAQEHPDCVQGWSRPDAAPTSNVTVKGIRATGNTQVVGFFNHRRTYPAGYRLADGTVLAAATELDDGGFGRVVVEGTDGVVSQPNALTVTAARELILRNNRFRTMPGSTFIAKINAGTSIVFERCGNGYAPALGKPGLDEAACPAR